MAVGNRGDGKPPLFVCQMISWDVAGERPTACGSRANEIEVEPAQSPPRPGPATFSPTPGTAAAHNRHAWCPRDEQDGVFVQLSHNQNPVLKWSTQNHVKN